MPAERPAPPILVFDPPPCSICGEETEYTDKTFRCDSCGAQWRRATAHIYPGTWDNPAADQCPDVLEEPEGLALGQCMRTAGHKGDHIHPDLGEWFADGEEG